MIDRPRIQKVWLGIEKYIFPKLKNVYTVNNSIASIYNEKYNVKVNIVKNIAPILKNKTIDIALSNKIKGNQKMLILQGAGINVDRGAEEAVEMMQYLENTILYIIGSGDVFETLKSLVNTLDLKNKVFIKDKMPYSELMEYTKIADLGLSLDKGTSLNYEYSLPNKVFDYIQAEIPLLVSNRKEIAELVTKNKIGLVIESHNPQGLANKVKEMFENIRQYEIWKENLSTISSEYCWENESLKLKTIFKNLK